jgi:DNA polymerase III alpha subunit
MSGFAHLHTHSYFSFLEGLLSPAELVQAAAEQGMPALALTDRNYLSGAIEFYTACQAAGIQPILGLQVTVTSPLESSPLAGDMVLLAQDLSGWSSLCRLSSSLLSEPSPAPQPVLAFDQLAQETSGLICLTAGGQGCLDQLLSMSQERSASRYLSQLKEIFPDRLFVELQRRTPQEITLSKHSARIARESGVPVVAANQVYYLSGDQAGMQKLVTAMRLNQRITELSDPATPPQGSYFTSIEEMQVRFSDIPGALDATAEISARCRLVLPLDQPRFPQVRLPSDQNAIQTLRAKAEQGAVTRYGPLDQEIKERLDYELSIIEDKGYTPLFLIMQEIVEQARLLGIPISSRGSAASSLVA